MGTRAPFWDEPKKENTDKNLMVETRKKFQSTKNNYLVVYQGKNGKHYVDGTPNKIFLRTIRDKINEILKESKQ
jgi:hypothetical protein